jgi:hypothetical protein
VIIAVFLMSGAAAGTWKIPSKGPTEDDAAVEPCWSAGHIQLWLPQGGLDPTDETLLSQVVPESRYDIPWRSSTVRTENN